MSDESSNVIPGVVSDRFLTDKGSGVDPAGSVLAAILGQGLKVAAGANGKLMQNVGPMVAGTLLVPNTSVTAASTIIPLHRGDGGNVGALREVHAARVVGASFTVTSTNAADVGHFDVLIIEAL